MDKNKVIEIVEDVTNKSNKDLFEVRDELIVEFEKTKDLIVDLTRHMDNIEEMYNIVNNEIGKRMTVK